MRINPAFSGDWRKLPGDTVVWTVVLHDGTLDVPCDTAWTERREMRTHFWYTQSWVKSKPKTERSLTLERFLDERLRGHHMNGFESVAIHKNVGDYKAWQSCHRKAER